MLEPHKVKLAKHDTENRIKAATNGAQRADSPVKHAYPRRLYSRRREVGRTVASVCLIVCPRYKRKKPELSAPKSVDI